MGVNWSNQVYLPQYDFFSRPVDILPVKSIPGAPSYTARGIFNTVPVDIIGLDGSNISEQRTILDILEAEFNIMPAQQDRVFIPVDPNGMPELGWFEINDLDTNGGGETTLTLRRLVTSAP